MLLTMKRLTLLIAVLALAGCGGRPSEPSAPETVAFPMVKVPGMYTDPGERLEYAVNHYWDAFTDTSRSYVCDSALVSGVPVLEVEQQVGNYTSLLGMAPLKTAQKAVSRAFGQLEATERADTSSNIFETVTELISRYLYDPNSPFRDEDIYLPFVQKLAESPFTESQHAGFAFDARMCALNQAGTKAADFGFTDLRGKRHRLYSVKAPYTLLFFTNPGCPTCTEIAADIQNDTRISAMIATGELAVVNVYIDQDIDEWKSYAVNYPETWHSGYNEDYTIRQNLDYHVRAIPSLYLLDEDKNVILKDAPDNKVFRFLNSL